MPFSIVRQDITRMKVDAIVNAANTGLLMGGGVCGAIFRAAGADRLQNACRPLAPISTGEAVITPGFALPAKFVIHTAGPVYDPGQPETCRRQLEASYRNSLELAAEHGCRSIAFPLISSGIYGYPREEALQTAVSAIGEFLNTHDMGVYLTIFDKASFSVSRELLGAVQSYIDENYVQAHTFGRSSLEPMFEPMEACKAAPDLDERIRNLDEPFNETLLRLIDDRGMTDAEVYKRANLDRKLFSKIRRGHGYMPGKRTVLALAIALKLNLEETDRLLEKAGYALSHSQKFDVIVEYFILSGQYDIYEINQVLFQYDQHLLGGG